MPITKCFSCLTIPYSISLTLTYRYCKIKENIGSIKNESNWFLLHVKLVLEKDLKCWFWPQDNTFQGSGSPVYYPLITQTKWATIQLVLQLKKLLSSTPFSNYRKNPAHRCSLLWNLDYDHYLKESMQVLQKSLWGTSPKLSHVSLVPLD